MSALLAWGIPIGYVLFGLGTARLIFTHQHGKHFPYWQAKSKDGYSQYARKDPHRLTANDPDVMVPTIFGGVFWPVGLAYMAVLRPVVVSGGPVFVKWFMAPAKRNAKKNEEAKK